jgi:hypothetical protein
VGWGISITRPAHPAERSEKTNRKKRNGNAEKDFMSIDHILNLMSPFITNCESGLFTMAFFHHLSNHFRADRDQLPMRSGLTETKNSKAPKGT